MSDAFLGEIRMFAGNYAPEGWLLCQGQTLQIGNSDYTALYSLIGTTYGGNGQTTFMLPDLRGRIPVGQGAGTNLTPRTLAQSSGSETVALTEATTPVHSHVLSAASAPTSSALANTSVPGPTVVPGTPPADRFYASYSGTAITGQMDGSSIAQSGTQGNAHPNVMPSVVINFIICMAGLYPPRPS